MAAQSSCSNVSTAFPRENGWEQWVTLIDLQHLATNKQASSNILKSYVYKVVAEVGICKKEKMQYTIKRAPNIPVWAGRVGRHGTGIESVGEEGVLNYSLHKCLHARCSQNQMA